jgi:hypothetical protein
MKLLGFSTGALAKGDFRRGIELQRRPSVSAIELSALREHELDSLLDSINSLDLSSFEFKSLHAPSALRKLSPGQLIDRLMPVVEHGMPIVVHPDILGDDINEWRALGNMLLLENMDSRKPVCRVASELRPFFEALPSAGFCFDIGHARQIDPTMGVAVEMLLEFSDKVREVHVSEVNWQCKHKKISTVAAMAFQTVAKWIPPGAPVIIESVIEAPQIDAEVSVVRRCLDPNGSIVSRLAQGVGEPVSA